jgi:hypothetical protein
MAVHLPLFNSLAPSISGFTLAMRPFFGGSNGRESLSKPRLSNMQANQRKAGGPAEIWIKDGSPGCEPTTYADRGLTPSPDAKAKGGRGQQASRGHRPRWPSRLNESRSAPISRAPFGYPDWGFPWFFPVVRQMPGSKMKSRGTARIPQPTKQSLPSHN